jgi:hypothetical protein
MNQQTLKERLKPPFVFDKDAVGDYFITDRSKNFILKIPALKASLIRAEFTVAALNEKWDRDFGEPMRWLITRSGRLNICPECGSYAERPFGYCHHCGKRLGPPEGAAG